ILQRHARRLAHGLDGRDRLAARQRGDGFGRELEGIRGHMAGPGATPTAYGTCPGCPLHGRAWAGIRDSAFGIRDSEIGNRESGIGNRANRFPLLPPLLRGYGGFALASLVLPQTLVDEAAPTREKRRHWAGVLRIPQLQRGGQAALSHCPSAARPLSRARANTVSCAPAKLLTRSCDHSFS